MKNRCIINIVNGLLKNVAHLSGWPRSHSPKADPQELLLNYRYIVNFADKQHSFIVGIWHRKWLLNYFLRWALLATLNNAFDTQIWRTICCQLRRLVARGFASHSSFPPLPLCLCFPLSLSSYCCCFFVAFASLADSLFMLLCTHTFFLFFLPPFFFYFCHLSFSSIDAYLNGQSRSLSPHSSLTDDDWGVMWNLLRRMTIMAMGGG